MQHAGEAEVVDLVGPGPHVAHLGAVGGAGLPVGDEGGVGPEGVQVDAAAEVDEGEAFGRPAVGAVGVVAGGPGGVSVGGGAGAGAGEGGGGRGGRGRGRGDGVEAHEAVVGLQVAVQDAVRVQGLDGAEELDGEEHGEAFVHDAAAAAAGGGGLRFGEVDEVEERALVAVVFDQEAFVGEEVQFVRADDGGGGAGGAEAQRGLPHDVEFPRRRWVFHLDGF